MWLPKMVYCSSRKQVKNTEPLTQREWKVSGHWGARCCADSGVAGLCVASEQAPLWLFLTFKPLHCWENRMGAGAFEDGLGLSQKCACPCADGPGIESAFWKGLLSTVPVFPVLISPKWLACALSKMFFIWSARFENKWLWSTDDYQIRNHVTKEKGAARLQENPLINSSQTQKLRARHINCCLSGSKVPHTEKLYGDASISFPDLASADCIHVSKCHSLPQKTFVF